MLSQLSQAAHMSCQKPPLALQKRSGDLRLKARSHAAPDCEGAVDRPGVGLSGVKLVRQACAEPSCCIQDFQNIVVGDVGFRHGSEGQRDHRYQFSLDGIEGWGAFCWLDHVHISSLKLRKNAGSDLAGHLGSISDRSHTAPCGPSERKQEMERIAVYCGLRARRATLAWGSACRPTHSRPCLTLPSEPPRQPCGKCVLWYAGLYEQETEGTA
jgi:hypothetical protein